jgi:hypothetical protein
MRVSSYLNKQIPVVIIQNHITEQTTIIINNDKKYMPGTDFKFAQRIANKYVDEYINNLYNNSI